MPLFAPTVNLFHSAHFLFNTSSGLVRALFCLHVGECGSMLRAEIWDDVWRFLYQPWLSRGDGVRGLHLPCDLAQHWIQASFPITVPQMIGPWKARKSRTSERMPTQRSSRSWATKESLASQACWLLFSFLVLLCLCSPCAPTDPCAYTYSLSPVTYNK